MTDHYNQHGWIFAKTYFYSDQQVSHKKYFNKSGQEVLSENILTGDILLNFLLPRRRGKRHFILARKTCGSASGKYASYFFRKIKQN